MKKIFFTTIIIVLLLSSCSNAQSRNNDLPAVAEQEDYVGERSEMFNAYSEVLGVLGKDTKIKPPYGNSEYTFFRHIVEAEAYISMLVCRVEVISTGEIVMILKENIK